jgi:hypothetical protein
MHTETSVIHLHVNAENALSRICWVHVVLQGLLSECTPVSQGSTVLRARRHGRSAVASRVQLSHPLRTPVTGPLSLLPGTWVQLMLSPATPSPRPQSPGFAKMGPSQAHTPHRKPITRPLPILAGVFPPSCPLVQMAHGGQSAPFHRQHAPNCVSTPYSPVPVVRTAPKTGCRLGALPFFIERRVCA